MKLFYPNSNLLKSKPDWPHISQEIKTWPTSYSQRMELPGIWPNPAGEVIPEQELNRQLCRLLLFTTKSYL